VPIETIELPVPEALANEAYDRIGEKITYRLAQRPAAYVVSSTSVPDSSCARAAAGSTPAPAGVIEGAGPMSAPGWDAGGQK